MIMIFSGMIPARRPVPGRSQALSRCIAALERDGCDVRRRGEILDVELPGFERWLMPRLEGGAGLLQGFRDRIEVRLVESGGIRFRMRYWSRPQILIHLLATTGLLAARLGQRQAGGWWELARAELVANLIPIGLFYLLFIYVKKRLMAGLGP